MGSTFMKIKCSACVENVLKRCLFNLESTICGAVDLYSY